MIRSTTLLFFIFALPGAASPLHDAAEVNDEQTVTSLLANGAQVDAVNQYGETPLHKAASQKAAESAALLMEQGANVNAKNQFGATPLHYATAKNARTVAALLLANGANVNAVNQLDHTPLHWAALENAGGMADLLIEMGADAEAVNGWFWFYNYSTDRSSWHRGKEWFDTDIEKFLALEKKRTERAKAESATKNLVSGAVGCALSGSGAGCSNAVSNAAVNWAAETAQIQQWESALSQLNADAPLHIARFLVPPNEQSRPIKYGARPFTRYVARLTAQNRSCTAFLVRRKIAMTNSHCVCHDQRCRNKIGVREMKLTFARKDLTGNHDIVVGVDKVYDTDRSAGYQNDYAFLVLDKAPVVGGYLEVATDATGVSLIATAGYPGDLLGGQVMTALWGCRLRENTDILFFSGGDCHNYKGASGSPYIAADGPHRGKVVGINAFGIGGDTNGGGPSVASFYHRLQNIIGKEGR